MDGAIIFLVVLLLLAMIGGGVYFFWYRQYSCNNRDADTSSNVATWLWSSDDSKCYANTCTDATYTTDGSSFICTKVPAKTATLTSVGTGKMSCTTPSGGTATLNASGTDPTSCGTQCTTGDGTCMGYSWDSTTGNTTSGCSIITGAAPTSESTIGGSCQSATRA